MFSTHLNSFGSRSRGPFNIYEYYGKIVEGSRPIRNENVPDHYWELIQRCLNQDPLERPTFEEITEILKDDKYGIKTDLDDLHDYQKRVDTQDLSQNFFIGSDDEKYHQVIEKIGEGATSVTYKVIDKRTD